MENIKVLTEKETRIEKLENALTALYNADLKNLSKKDRRIFLCGFCLAKYNEDVVFQMCFAYGRDIEEAIVKLLISLKNEN